MPRVAEMARSKAAPERLRRRTSTASRRPSLEPKWCFVSPGDTPASAAIVHTVTPSKPWAANRRIATCSSRMRPRAESASIGAAGTNDTVDAVRATGGGTAANADADVDAGACGCAGAAAGAAGAPRRPDDPAAPDPRRAARRPAVGALMACEPATRPGLRPLPPPLPLPPALARRSPRPSSSTPAAGVVTKPYSCSVR